MTEESHSRRVSDSGVSVGCCTDNEVSPMSSTSPSPGMTSASSSTAGYRGPSQVTRRVIHRCTELEQQAAAEVAKNLLALSEKTGFVLCQHNGQRRFASPDPSLGMPPGRGTEVFVARIPRDVYEDELVPLFMQCGPVYEFRLMMDFSGTNRGFGFCRYMTADAAQMAVKKLNNYEIRSRVQLGVVPSMDNRRLYIRGLPKNRSREEVKAELSKLTDAVSDVTIFANVADKAKNRGFAFIEYYTHKDAAMARRALNPPGKVQIFGCNVVVDWAESEMEIDPEVMKTVRELFARNFGIERTREEIEDGFTKLAEGVSPERVHKQRDYAFIRFNERAVAERVLENASDPEKLRIAFPEDEEIGVEWAKPVSADKHLRYNLFGSPRSPNGPRAGPRCQKPGLLPQPTFFNPFFSTGFSAIPPFTPPAYCAPGTLLGSAGMPPNGLINGQATSPGYLAPPGFNAAYRTWEAFEMASNNPAGRFGCTSIGNPLVQRNMAYRQHGPRRGGLDDLSIHKQRPGEFNKDSAPVGEENQSGVPLVGLGPGDVNHGNGHGDTGHNGAHHEDHQGTAVMTEGFSMMNLGNFPGYIPPGPPVSVYPGAPHGYTQLTDGDHQAAGENANNFVHPGLHAVPVGNASRPDGEPLYQTTNGQAAVPGPVHNYYGIPGNQGDWAFAAAAYNQYYHQHQLVNQPAPQRGYIHPGLAYGGQDYYEINAGIIPQQPVA